MFYLRNVGNAHTGVFESLGTGFALLASGLGGGTSFWAASQGADGMAALIQQYGVGATQPAAKIISSSTQNVALYVEPADPTPSTPAAFFQGSVGLGTSAGAGTGVRSIDFNPDDGDGFPAMRMRSTSPFQTLVAIDANANGNGAEFYLWDANGTQTVDIQSAEAGSGAQIQLRDSAGKTRITLDAQYGGSGEGRITTEVLEITGGADLVEGFATSDGPAEPGSVLVIDAEHAGHLLVSAAPYDSRVAGVVSGAGGVKAGLRLGQAGALDGDTPVALTGRVYVRCSTENGAIRPGDLLTTSSLAGHAMKATDPARAFGATIGKAMSTLDEGTGLVLVLVALH